MTTNDRQHFYDGIADRFDELMNPYDLRRRLHVVFTQLLGPGELAGRLVLDVGCGTGWFSREAERAGARVVALDIGLRLLERVGEKCGARRVAADACRLSFRPGVFDVVVSSECIEHTVDPPAAIAEMCRVLKPGGVLALTVPNRVWKWAEVIARVFRLRPYEGLENWLWPRDLTGALRRHAMRIERLQGVHLLPPVWRWTWPLLERVEATGRAPATAMVNLAVRARK